MSDIGKQIVAMILEGLGSVMVALICVGLKHLISWIKSKARSEKLNAALDDLHNCITEGIFYIEQEFVKQYKQQGSWNDETKAAVKQECINYIEKVLSTATKDFLSDDPKERVEMISNKIEAELGKLHEKSRQEG